MLNNSLGNWFTLNELGFLSAFCPSRTRSSNPTVALQCPVRNS
jgi:hypothetical protein